MKSVGVRELRQQASALLDRVVAGEVIEVTNHGNPVARLVPIGAQVRTREEMLRSGELMPGRGNLAEVAPVRRPRGVPSTSRLLAELRDER